jgi:hypothetical protein
VLHDGPRFIWECSAGLAYLADMNPPLSIFGVPVYVSGVAGHFVGADRCVLRLHWRIGNFRISTVGGWQPQRDDQPFEKLGTSHWSETFVFRVRDREGVPEGELADDNPLATKLVPGSDTREAERMHYSVTTAVAGQIAAGHDDAASIMMAVAGCS